MKELKISVIVPIFNAEKYLVKCLDSIKNQRYSNLEIILVNDGSTDSSKSIIEKYESEDDRILAIHKANGGIGSAYRVALEKVSGDYISFVDSDDYIDLSMYEVLIKNLAGTAPDIIHFGASLFNDKGEFSQSHNTSDLIVEGNENILYHHFTYIKFPGLGCRIFKKNLFSKVIFFDQNIGIDEMAIVQVLAQCNKAVYISRTLYYAYEREESVSRIKYSRQKVSEGIKVYRFICNYIEKNKEKYAPYLYIKYLSYLISTYDTGRVETELVKSEELSIIVNEIYLYFNKVKRNSIYKNEHLYFKFRVKTFMISPYFFSLYASIIQFIKNNQRRLRIGN